MVVQCKIKYYFPIFLVTKVCNPHSDLRKAAICNTASSLPEIQTKKKSITRLFYNQPVRFFSFRPVQEITFVLFVKMGCDGGTIPKRHELVKGPKKVEKVCSGITLASFNLS
jgi:hypothetical protein